MIGWVDVETTGLDVVGNGLLEVGLIVTDDDLVEVSRWSAVIRQPPHILNIANPKVLAMHEKSGLLAECAASKLSSLRAQFNLIDVLMNSTAERPVMAGSTIGFDRMWLRAKMPHLEAAFHYRSIDVSSLKELNARWGFAPEWDGDRDLHRALPDLEDSIAELKHYRSAFGLAWQ